MYITGQKYEENATFANVSCKIHHMFLHGSPDISARFVRESSAIADERPYIGDECTDIDDVRTDADGGGTFPRQACNFLLVDIRLSHIFFVPLASF